MSRHQIDLEPHHHSTLIEVVKTPKRLFFTILAIWVVMSLGMVFAVGLPWFVVCYSIFGGVVGGGWVSAYPEYHMRRIKD